MAEPAGHSGTPSIREPGLKPDSTVRLLDAPDHYRGTIGQGPDDPGIELLDEDDHGAALTHPFATRRDGG